MTDILPRSVAHSYGIYNKRINVGKWFSSKEE